MSFKVIVPQGSPPPLAPYSPGAKAGNVCNLNRSTQSIQKQAFSEPLPVKRMVDAKPRQQHDRDCVPGEALFHPHRRIVVGNAANGEAVVAGNGVLCERKVGRCAARCLVGYCK